MPAPLIVEDRHFDFLRLQKGSLDKFAHDRGAWEIAYEQSLAKDFGSIRPHLPASCGSILDVGGGMGGIDALLVKKFGKGCEVCILDGEADEPVMHLHRETFNNMEVARDFLGKNGVEKFSYYTPELRQAPRPFDLIISLGSWCFHYPPETYLQFVRSCCTRETTLIVDVRRGKPSWSDLLDNMFTLRAVIHPSVKFDRRVYRAG